ncbi:hypothetical protein V2J09_014706 [Rumex salicifolius]
MFYNTKTFSSLATCLFVLVMVVAVIEPSVTNAIWPVPPKVTVRARNALTSRDKLVVHCKDPHDDIGLKYLWFDQSFSFTFRPDWAGGSVLYHCSFQWTGVTQRFDIYNQPRDEKVCIHECNWNVLESGPCLHNPNGGDSEELESGEPEEPDELELLLPLLLELAELCDCMLVTGEDTGVDGVAISGLVSLTA